MCSRGAYPAAAAAHARAVLRLARGQCQPARRGLTQAQGALRSPAALAGRPAAALTRGGQRTGLAARGMTALDRPRSHGVCARTRTRTQPRASATKGLGWLVVTREAATWAESRLNRLSLYKVKTINSRRLVSTLEAGAWWCEVACRVGLWALAPFLQLRLTF